MKELEIKGQAAKTAGYQLGLLSAQEKNTALLAMADALLACKETILAANQLDMANANAKGMDQAFLDRLLLTEDRLESMAQGLRQVAALEDPIGHVDEMWLTEDNLQIGKMRVPLGVIGIIYEARPNVTADAAGLCLKSGNAVLLRGSSDAINSNKALVQALDEAAQKTGIPQGAIALIEDTSRECVNAMLRLNDYLDVLIPRGGAGLIRNVVENATVPVIETGTGNCHVYVDDSADLDMAQDIVYNGKVQRPGVCNATETLLVHQNIAEIFLPKIAEKLLAANVELRCDEKAHALIPESVLATDEDYATEFHRLILAVKVVSDIHEAIEHINHYGTKHSEVIVTNRYDHGQLFQKAVDAACVYINASSRFSDGFQFGFGAEIGISTQKLHARGPMGLKELTSYKYIIFGQGQIRK